MASGALGNIPSAQLLRYLKEWAVQKESHKGISTPKHEMDLVEARLKLARLHAEGVEK